MIIKNYLLIYLIYMGVACSKPKKGIKESQTMPISYNKKPEN